MRSHRVWRSSERAEERRIASSTRANEICPAASMETPDASSQPSANLRKSKELNVTQPCFQVRRTSRPTPWSCPVADGTRVALGPLSQRNCDSDGSYAHASPPMRSPSASVSSPFAARPRVGLASVLGKSLETRARPNGSRCTGGSQAPVLQNMSGVRCGRDGAKPRCHRVDLGLVSQPQHRFHSVGAPARPTGGHHPPDFPLSHALAEQDFTAKLLATRLESFR